MLVETISMLTNRYSHLYYQIFHQVSSVITLIAEVAELADALGSGPSVRKDVGVRIPASAYFISDNT